MAHKGLFVSFEGGEGSGKDTQIKLLKDDLVSAGYDVLVAREPGGVPLSEEIRKLILNPDFPKRSLTELFLYEAARVEFVGDLVIPHLLEGGIFIANRFYHSTEAYQGHGGGVSIPLIRQLNRVASQETAPDITFLLDVPVHIGLERAAQAKNEFGKKDWQESKKIDFHERLRKGYLEMAADDDHFRVIDATKSIDEVYREIIYHMTELMNNRNYK